MADKSKDILQKLQQYGVTPPADAFDKAWERISEEKNWTEKKKFSQLQEFPMSPPELDFELLKTKKRESEAAPVKKILSPSLKRAAAVLILIASSTFLYFTIFNKKQGQQEQTVAGIPQDKISISVNPPAGSHVYPGSDSTVLPSSTAVNTKVLNEKGRTIRNKPFAAKARKGAWISIGDNNSIQLYDNDILFTLANYKGNTDKWISFLTGVSGNARITLNKYSWVNLSDKMALMLQDIYGTKKNGKSTRKAKRTKKKFDKWKKRDEKYFDRNMQKNPLDIVDLSDLILK